MKYRPPKSSPLYEACRDQDIMAWAMGMASGSGSMGGLYSVSGQKSWTYPTTSITSVPNSPAIGDSYTDNSTGESYLWDGFAWLHQGYVPPRFVKHGFSWQTTSNVPPNQAWVIDNSQYQREYLNGVPMEELDRKYGKRSPS